METLDMAGFGLTYGAEGVEGRHAVNIMREGLGVHNHLRAVGVVQIPFPVMNMRVIPARDYPRTLA